MPPRRWLRWRSRRNWTRRSRPRSPRITSPRQRQRPCQRAGRGANRVEVAGIEPASSRGEPDLLRAQLAGVVFSAPTLDASAWWTSPALVKSRSAAKASADQQAFRMRPGSGRKATPGLTLRSLYQAARAKSARLDSAVIGFQRSLTRCRWLLGPLLLELPSQVETSHPLLSCARHCRARDEPEQISIAAVPHGFNARPRAELPTAARA